MRKILALAVAVVASLVAPVVTATPALAQNCLAVWFKLSSGKVGGSFDAPDGLCQIQARVDWYQHDYPQSYFGPITTTSSVAEPPSTGSFVSGWGRYSNSTGPMTQWIQQF